MNLHRPVTAGAVALRGRSYAVVLELRGDEAVLAPVVRQPQQRRRGDVAVTFQELGQDGSEAYALVARCGEAATVARSALSVVASVAAPVLAELQRARAQAEATAAEERRTPAGVFPSNLMRSVGRHPCGRPVGRKGGC